MSPRARPPARPTPRATLCGPRPAGRGEADGREPARAAALTPDGARPPLCALWLGRQALAGGPAGAGSPTTTDTTAAHTAADPTAARRRRPT
eukprot:1912175-Prymnesium_polylepis.2